MPPIPGPILPLLILLAACAPADGRRLSGGGPFAPAGLRSDAEYPDGLIVGHRLMAAGEYELALKAYLRGAAQHGAGTDVLSALGSANLKLGRLGQAERLLRQAVKEDPAFVPAWNNLGVVLMERGEIGEASEVFRRAFALDSGRSDLVRNNLALALAKLDAREYPAPQSDFALVRRGGGEYRILQTP
ncbi:MAG: tetratricopeptide repeat protein [Tranquillimonas sp.]